MAKFNIRAQNHLFRQNTGRRANLQRTDLRDSKVTNCFFYFDHFAFHFRAHKLEHEFFSEREIECNAFSSYSIFRSVYR